MAHLRTWSCVLVGDRQARIVRGPFYVTGCDHALVPPRESIWVHWTRLSAVIGDPAIPSRVQLGVREGSLLASSSSDWVPG